MTVHVVTEVQLERIQVEMRSHPIVVEHDLVRSEVVAVGFLAYRIRSVLSGEGTGEPLRNPQNRH